jgi:hypothetical protein
MPRYQGRMKRKTFAFESPPCEGNEVKNSAIGWTDHTFNPSLACCRLACLACSRLACWCWFRRTDLGTSNGRVHKV